MSIAKVIGQRSHLVPGTVLDLPFSYLSNRHLGKLKITEWFFEVPKDYSKPADGTLRLFARSTEKVQKPADPAKDEPQQQPWCQ